MERVCNRAGRELVGYPNLDKKYLKAIQFYTGDEEVEKYYTQEITDKNVHFMKFSVFLSLFAAR